MEEQGKALADLTAAIEAMTAKIDDIHPIVLEFQGWRPTIEQSVEDLRAEVGDLHAQLRDKGKATDPAVPLRAPPPTGPSQEPSQHQAPLLLHPPPIRLVDLPPIPSHVADEPFHRVGEPLPACRWRWPRANWPRQDNHPPGDVTGGAHPEGASGHGYAQFSVSARGEFILWGAQLPQISTTTAFRFSAV